MRKTRKNYLVGICNTEDDGVTLSRVNGTECMIIKYLIKLLKSDRKVIEENYGSCFDYGAETAEDIIKRQDGSLHAFATYNNFHIDYSAIPESEPYML